MPSDPSRVSNVVQCYLQAMDQLSKEVESQNIADGFLRTVTGAEMSNTAGDDNSSSDSDITDYAVEEMLQHNLYRHEDLDRRNSEDLVPPTFTTRGQARTGSHHGRGGRRVGSGFRVRELYKRFAKLILCGRMCEICAENPHNATRLLISELKRTERIEGDSGELALLCEDKLLSTLQDMSAGEHPYTVQHLPFSVLGVSARFTKSDSLLLGGVDDRKSCERHVVNTWIGSDGQIRCTCIGSTQYSILAQNNEFHVPCCEHTEAFKVIFNSVGEKVFGIPELKGIVLYSCFSALQTDLLDSLNNHLPFYSFVHRSLGAVLVCEDLDGHGNPSWIPIRHVQRKGIKYLCAFCDLLNNNSCCHVKTIHKLLADGAEAAIPLPPSDSQEVEENKNCFRKDPPISFLPVAPVNCPFALQVDKEICALVQKSSTFVLRAPSCCIYCGSPRLEDTKDVNTSGLVLCTVGACRMELHTYKCSNCNRRFSAEGRDEGIFVESICTAGTHAMLREELIGFALGNGSLSSRLNQLHSKLTSYEDAKMFTNPLPSKSAKTIYSMCIRLANLIVASPPKSLFFCPTCQRFDPPTGRVSVPRTVCVDGIWAGYLKKAARAFQNVSVFCKADKGTRNKSTRSNSSQNKSSGRPRTTMLRLQKTVSFLMQALKGEKIDLIASQVNALVAAIKIVNGKVLPSDFYKTSVCGRSPNDYSDDDGDCRLMKVRNLTVALFDEGTLLYRLLKPLQDYFEKQCKRRRKNNKKGNTVRLEVLLCDEGDNKKTNRVKSASTSRAGTKRKERDENWNLPDRCADLVSQVLQLQLSPLGADEEERIPWNSKIAKIATKNDFGHKVLRLYKAFLQGPVTHLIRKTEIKSASLLAESCIQNDATAFLKDMITKEQFNVEDNGGSGSTSNIAKTVRLLTGGLASAGTIDKEAREDVPTEGRLLGLFGDVLQEALCIVKEFYVYYEGQQEAGFSSAAEYERDWNSRDYPFLRSKFEALSNSDSFQDAAGWDYDDMYTTGTFFPSFPQLRPLPFNDEGKSKTDEELFGFCSKHYLQKKGSFTPGAITFCCACAHPIILGFKVLEWDEGPRAILDVLISRFLEFPRFIIYDFACGVYKSALHPLWWAVKDSTLVSDPFHGCNHKCSPAFLPSAHIELNSMNTIAHEQRNRPIADIKSSLQQTSQDVYISLLAFQTIINNIKAKTRTAAHSQVPAQNRSEHDLEWGYFQRLNLTCPCCEARDKTGSTNLGEAEPTAEATAGGADTEVIKEEKE